MTGSGVEVPSLVGQCPTECEVAMLGVGKLVKVDEIGPNSRDII